MPGFSSRHKCFLNQNNTVSESLRYAQHSATCNTRLTRSRQYL